MLKHRRHFAVIYRQPRRNRAAMIGLGLILIEIPITLLVPWITPYDPLAQVSTDALQPLSAHRCRLPEAGGGHRDVGSAAHHSGSEHKHGVSTMERGVFFVHHFGAALNAHVHMHL